MYAAKHHLMPPVKEYLPELEQHSQAGACNDVNMRKVKDNVAVGLLTDDVDYGLKLAVHLRLSLKLKNDDIA
jgi:hypothetical protein